MTGSVRSDFFVRMVLAAGHLGNGEIDEACDAARQALDLGTALRFARCTEYVRAFRQQLADFDRLPAVRDLGQRGCLPRPDRR